MRFGIKLIVAFICCVSCALMLNNVLIYLWSTGIGESSLDRTSQVVDSATSIQNKNSTIVELNYIFELNIPSDISQSDLQTIIWKLLICKDPRTDSVFEFIKLNQIRQRMLGASNLNTNIFKLFGSSYMEEIKCYPRDNIIEPLKREDLFYEF